MDRADKWISRRGLDDTVALRKGEVSERYWGQARDLFVVWLSCRLNMTEWTCASLWSQNSISTWLDTFYLLMHGWLLGRSAPNWLIYHVAEGVHRFWWLGTVKWPIINYIFGLFLSRCPTLWQDKAELQILQPPLWQELHGSIRQQSPFHTWSLCFTY